MELKKINRILEVGVFMGGSSSIFAGCIENTEVEFDMLDVNSIYLRYAYERIRRLFPEVAKRTRMFLGDLPTYVKSVLSQEKKRQYLIHHDGSHNFNEVISDLASLSFVRDKVRGLMIQDTHLRGGNINSYIFVDAAVYAIFGADVDHSKLGVTLSSKQTVPAFQFDPHGTYLKANLPEGMYIPFANNTFQYPHPQTSLDDIIMKH